ncbi:MAG: hypothetical protein A2033_08000 [Bacteroidetes bacterium GWA2_31_9]|nr:MAG: hypothetical protein A2033_08000 [Bacteroidetes bacterium GWA2_31_9]
MKKTLFLGIIALIVSNLNAQITLKHTFSGNISVVNTHHKTVYFDAVINGNQFDFYNEDYSFYKTVTVAPLYGCKAYYISNVSDNLFNTDNDLEFTCAFLDTLNNQGYKLQLINENGTVIKDFGSVVNWGFPHKTVNNDVRFLVTRYVTYPAVSETEIYSLPGSIASTKALVSEANEYAPYPNPAKNFINLKYNLNQSEVENLQIFNSAGQIIETKQIGGAFDKIVLDISSYPSGQYFYKYKTITQKFIVE